MPKFNLSSKIILHTDFGEFSSFYCSRGENQGVVVESPKEVVGDFYVRIHSSCLFSEALKSNDCDCSSQLEESLRIIQKLGGVVIYVYDEGRGAGLKNKFDAISLQQKMGLNTVEAFKTLGLIPDLRSYEFAASILKEFYPNREIILLTNNPGKAESVKSQGINVKGTKRVVVVRNGVTLEYLKEKERHLGHQIF